MSYVYRLESDWDNRWGSYFGNNLQYSCFRGIDRLERHNIQISLANGEDLCGLWVLTDFSDVIKFQVKSTGFPDLSDTRYIEELSHNCLRKLHGNGGMTTVTIRLPVRISVEFFGRDILYNDIPNINVYKSSRFYIKKFFTHGDLFIKGDTLSDRVIFVSVPDKFVDVYFLGTWWKKSVQLREHILNHFEKCGHIRDIILSPSAEAAPVASLPLTPVRKPETFPPIEAPRSLRDRLCHWLRHR